MPLFRCLAAVVIAATWFPALAAENQPDDSAPALHWLIYDTPPAFLRDPATTPPEQIGTGVGDRMLNRVIAALPQWRHIVELRPFPRIVDSLKSGQEACGVALYRSTERDAISYATPLFITETPSVVLRPDLLERHPEWRGGVRLATIIRQPDLVGEISLGRSFGLRWETILAAAAGGNLHPNPHGLPQNLYRMIAAGRIDYTVAYLQSMSFDLAHSDIAPDALVGIPILDLDPFMVSSILCPRTKWGLTTIRAIDAALQQLAKDPSFRALMIDWIPVPMRRTMLPHIEEFYQTRASGPSIEPPP
jgi:uncharacterized protein (TIGR02285 family)